MKLVMSILEFIGELLSSLHLLSGSKSDKTESFSNKKSVFILQASSSIIGLILLYIETDYIFGLKESGKSILVFFGLAILISLILTAILYKFEILYSLKITEFLWLIISFTLFFTSLLFGINFILSDLFFEAKSF